MILSDLLAVRQYEPLQQQRERVASPQGQLPQGETFADTLKEFAGDVNAQQVESGDATERMIKGEPIDIHDVMIAAEKAKTSFQLLLELRNKALDLYREVIRIQV